MKHSLLYLRQVSLLLTSLSSDKVEKTPINIELSPVLNTFSNVLHLRITNLYKYILELGLNNKKNTHRCSLTCGSSLAAFPPWSVGVRHAGKGDPKSRNDGTAEWRNGGITERRKIPPNPKRRNRGITERRKIPPNPKRRNDGKSPKILKDGITENQPKS